MSRLEDRNPDKEQWLSSVKIFNKNEHSVKAVLVASSYRRTFRISRVRPSTLSTLSTCPHAAHADDTPRPCMAHALSL